jgi:hypothetical protein
MLGSNQARCAWPGASNGGFTCIALFGIWMCNYDDNLRKGLMSREQFWFFFPFRVR